MGREVSSFQSRCCIPAQPQGALPGPSPCRGGQVDARCRVREEARCHLPRLLMVRSSPVEPQELDEDGTQGGHAGQVRKAEVGTAVFLDMIIPGVAYSRIPNNTYFGVTNPTNQAIDEGGRC